MLVDIAAGYAQVVAVARGDSVAADLLMLAGAAAAGPELDQYPRVLGQEGLKLVEIA